MQTTERPKLLYLLEKLRCPSCLSEISTLQARKNDLFCDACRAEFPDENGVPSLIHPEHRSEVEGFNHRYDMLRLKEGWACEMPGYYDALPLVDVKDLHREEWQQRARRFRIIEKWITRNTSGHPLEVLDAGCGTGWTSRRLAAAGHSVIGADINPGRHGLQAVIATSENPVYLQAGLEHLPFLGHSFDLVLFNASLHHSMQLEETLERTWHILRKDGICLILDSPVYSDVHALWEAKERTRQYFTALECPDLAPFYNPFIKSDIMGNDHFYTELLAKDISVAAWLKKGIRARRGKTVGAYFPIFICRPLNKSAETAISTPVTTPN